MSRLRAEGPALAVLGVMMVVGLVLRVLHNDHGLPYVYYVDEGSHFTKRAVEVFRDANPGYFQNPSAYTYLLHLVYRAVALPFGGGERIIEGYRTNAEWVFEISRGLAALLCLAGVAAVYAVGRQLWDRRTGLVAAAVLCFAFLPVAFSRLAVTDVGTLAPVALALLGSVRIARGRGLAHVPVGGRGRRAGDRLQVHGGARAAGARAGARAGAARPPRRAPRCGPPRPARSPSRRGSLAAFFVTNPYFFLDLDTALHQLRGQAELAGSQDKFGQEQDTGAALLPRQPAVGPRLRRGVRRRGRRGPARAPRPHAARAAARLPGRAVPLPERAVALLRALAAAGLPGARAARRLRASCAGSTRACAGAGGCSGRRSRSGSCCCCGSRSPPTRARWPCSASEDTRAIARQWLAENYGRASCASIIEPAVPERYYWPVGDGRPERLARAQFVNEFIRDIREDARRVRPHAAPGVLDRYRAEGYCMVMTFDLIRGRAEAAGRPRRARLLRRARARVRRDLPRQPVPRRRGAAAVQLRPQLQLLLARLRAARARGRIHRLRDCASATGRGRRR